jgi:hypothetical protein
MCQLVSSEITRLATRRGSPRCGNPRRRLRDKQQRGTKNSVTVFRLAPLESAHGCKKCVRAIFFQSVPGSSVKFGQTSTMLCFFQVRVEAPVL